MPAVTSPLAARVDKSTSVYTPHICLGMDSESWPDIKSLLPCLNEDQDSALQAPASRLPEFRATLDGQQPPCGHQGRASPETALWLRRNGAQVSDELLVFGRKAIQRGE